MKINQPSQAWPDDFEPQPSLSLTIDHIDRNLYKVVATTSL